MAAVDAFDIHVRGSIVQAVQTIVSRNHTRTDALVVSVTQIHAGSAHNVIPDTAWISGTVRTLDPAMQAMARKRMQEIVAGQAASFGIEAVLDHRIGDPASVNGPASLSFAAQAAREVAGIDHVGDACEPEMGAEDFSYMLPARPGAGLPPTL